MTYSSFIQYLMMLRMPKGKIILPVLRRRHITRKQSAPQVHAIGCPTKVLRESRRPTVPKEKEEDTEISIGSLGEHEGTQYNNRHTRAKAKA